MSTTWFGALPFGHGVRFRLCAPGARTVSLVLHDGRSAGRHVMGRDDEGVFDRIVDGAAPGDRYGYAVDDGEPRPDPASRFQPDGVHGPSLVVDPAYAWRDGGWRGRSASDLIIYELHVGTFSPEGTFAGVARRLPSLRDLGVTAIELMPVAAAPGNRNWGYDGVSLYAPSAAYGTPEDLRRLVDEAHHFALAVILDVVYNHLGPEGAYLSELNPQYVTDRHATPWGYAINVDGPGSAMVRRFIVDNAVHWIREYHVDGLRLDATHALVDDSSPHIVSEIADAARSAAARAIVVHAEDDRNLAAMIEDGERGGWGLDGMWADDFHHVMQRLLAGDADGYYGDFQGTTEELAATIRQGWLYTGQPSARRGKPRGSDPSRVPMYRFVVCLQNHDQVGNRATGDRLHHGISPEAWRAASTVLLSVPMTPLLFMGQEWATAAPFQYFTHLATELGRRVTEGRRREFADFPQFSRPESLERIPDPQSPSTFEVSRLPWSERDEPAHAAVLRLYQALLALRREHRALAASTATSGEAEALDPDTLAMRRTDDGEDFLVIARLRGSGTIDVGSIRLGPDDDAYRSSWEVVLTTEDALFAPDPAPITVDRQPDGPVIHFSRPGATILRRR